MGNCDGCFCRSRIRRVASNPPISGIITSMKIKIVGLAVQRRQRFQTVGRQVGPIPHLLEQTQRDLLVDDVVITQQYPQRQAAGERRVKFGAGGGSLRRGRLGAGHHAEQGFVELGRFDRLGQATREGSAGEVRTV